MQPVERRKEILFARLTKRNMIFLDFLANKIYGNARYNRAKVINALLEELRTKKKVTVDS